MPGPWIGAGLAVTLAALIAGFGPFPLLARLHTGRETWRHDLWAPAVALAAGLAVFALGGGLLGWRIGAELGIAAACLGAMALIDLRHLVIPDLHVVMLAVLALAGPLADSWLAAGLGALIGGGLLLGVRALYRWRTGAEALGLGDVKLMAALGALCGAQPVLWVIVASSVLGVGVGLVRNRGRVTGAPPLPFGALAAVPAMAALALAAFGARP